MSARNKAQIRYRILDRCFRDTTKDYTLSDLLMTVNRLLETDCARNEPSFPHRRARTGSDVFCLSLQGS